MTVDQGAEAIFLPLLASLTGTTFADQGTGPVFAIVVVAAITATLFALALPHRRAADPVRPS